MLIFYLCVAFSSIGFGGSIEQRLFTNSSKVSKKEFPNIFRPIGKLFKRLFGKHQTIREYPMANVKSITLSQNQSQVVYSTVTSKEIKGCLTKRQPTNVLAKANEEQRGNETYSYRYNVSGGKILGEGREVIWDLSGVAPGNYRIMVEVDDGCGFCGQSVTTEICIVE